MLEIQVKKRRWPGVLAAIFALLLIVVGAYVLLVVFAPDIPSLSGRAQHEAEEKLTKPAGTFGDRLYIPQINVDVEILTGKDNSVLEKGAWHRKPENGDPEKGGNFILSAHRFVMSFTPQGTAIKSPFYNIGKLNIGDRIFIDYKSVRYKYEITKKYAVKPNAVEIEAPTEEPRLTLYSCTLEGSTDGREVLEAKPVISLEQSGAKE